MPHARPRAIAAGRQTELFARPLAPGRELAFSVLASGSSGNAAVVRADGTCVLVDCGISTKRIEEGLAGIGLGLGDVDAVLVTHLHSDHAAHLPGLLKRFVKMERHVPVLTSAPVAGRLQRRLRKLGDADQVTYRLLSRHPGWTLDGFVGTTPITPGEPIVLGALDVLAVRTRHDSTGSVAFAFAAGGKRLAIISDTGEVTPDMRALLPMLDAALIEFNHDVHRLIDGPYPERLKQRILSPLGHLDNRTAADLIADRADSRLRTLVMGHLSRHNNTPDLAERELRDRLARLRPALASSSTLRIETAPPDRPTPLLPA